MAAVDDNDVKNCLEVLTSLKSSLHHAPSSHSKEPDESAPPPKRQSSMSKKSFLKVKIEGDDDDDATRKGESGNTNAEPAIEHHEVVFNTATHAKPKPSTSKSKSKQRPRAKSKPIDIFRNECAIPNLTTILKSESTCSTSAPSSTSFLANKPAFLQDFRDDAAIGLTSTATKTTISNPSLPADSVNGDLSSLSTAAPSSAPQKYMKRRYEWLTPYTYVKDPDAKARIAELEVKLAMETQRRMVIEEEFWSKQNCNNLNAQGFLQFQYQQGQNILGQQQKSPRQMKPRQDYVPLPVRPRRMTDQIQTDTGRIQLSVAEEAGAEAAAAAAVVAAVTGSMADTQGDAGGSGDAGQRKKRQYKRYNKKTISSITDTDAVIQNTLVQKQQQQVIQQVLQSNPGASMGNLSSSVGDTGINDGVNPRGSVPPYPIRQPNLLYDKDGDAIMSTISFCGIINSVNSNNPNNNSVPLMPPSVPSALPQIQPQQQ